ncbi:MAG: glycosyltransferase [Myxococcales bacterium]|nr:glycosyltransferase [Myxococcales bacterium]
MLDYLGFFMLLASVAGAVAVILQVGFTRRSLRQPPAWPKNGEPGISILKPLCGIDDELEENLACFASLDYPTYEVVLGVKNAADPAYEVAQNACRRWPGKMRLVVQRGEPGYNPKVNQLVTLEGAARFDLVVISDSNTRVHPGYLREIAALFEDPQVGCVTHPIVGSGDQKLGSMLDNLHLSSDVGPGMIAAAAVGQPLVVGKSMALRRDDLLALGGFESMKDLLAEDYVIGKGVREQLKKKIVVAHGTVVNVSCRRSIKDFYRRYSRWEVIHRSVVQPTTYLGEALLNPTPLALIAAALNPTWWVVATAALVGGVKALVDAMAVRAMRGRRLYFKELAALPLRDVLLFVAWVVGLVRETVDWRGNRLRVCTGSRLLPGISEEAESPARAA